MLIPCVQGGASGATAVAVFAASDWGTVLSEFDFSKTATITASSGAVSRVTDNSGSRGIAISQATAGAKPTTGSVFKNTLNTLSFDGGDFLLEESDPADQAQPLTIAMVLQSANVDSGNRQAWGNYGDPEATVFVNSDAYSLYAGSAVSSGVTEDANWHVVVAIFNGASSAMWIDGVSHTLNPSTNPSKHIRIGSGNGAFFWNGAIGHAILYNAAVASPSGLSSALNAKWAVY